MFFPNEEMFNLDEASIWDATNAIQKTFRTHNDLARYWKQKKPVFHTKVYDFETVPLEDYDEWKDAYDKLNDPDTQYDTYKECFSKFCKLFNLIPATTIIEALEIRKQKDDVKITMRYSTGLVKVNIPADTALVHVSPVGGIEELKPSRKSKVEGKYLYPSSRVYFTIRSAIDIQKAGLEKNKDLYAYTPEKHVSFAYIDPACSDYESGAVFVPTSEPIKVTTKHVKGISNEEESKNSTFIKLLKELVHDLWELIRSVGTGNFSTVRARWIILCQHVARNARNTKLGKKIASILNRKPNDKDEATDQIKDLNAEIKNIKEANNLSEAATIYLNAKGC